MLPPPQPPPPPQSSFLTLPLMQQNTVIILLHYTRCHLQFDNLSRINIYCFIICVFFLKIRYLRCPILAIKMTIGWLYDPAHSIPLFQSVIGRRISVVVSAL